MTPDYGLPADALQAIREVLAAHPGVTAAILYGSRALGRERPGSDIDLTLRSIPANPPRRFDSRYCARCAAPAAGCGASKGRLPRRSVGVIGDCG